MHVGLGEEAAQTRIDPEERVALERVARDGTLKPDRLGKLERDVHWVGPFRAGPPLADSLKDALDVVHCVFERQGILQDDHGVLPDARLDDPMQVLMPAINDERLGQLEGFYRPFLVERKRPAFSADIVQGGHVRHVDLLARADAKLDGLVCMSYGWWRGVERADLVDGEPYQRHARQGYDDACVPFFYREHFFKIGLMILNIRQVICHALAPQQAFQLNQVLAKHEGPQEVAGAGLAQPDNEFVYDGHFLLSMVVKRCLA